MQNWMYRCRKVKVSTTVYKFNKKLYKYVRATIGLEKIVYFFNFQIL